MGECKIDCGSFLATFCVQQIGKDYFGYHILEIEEGGDFKPATAGKSMDIFCCACSLSSISTLLI